MYFWIYFHAFKYSISLVPVGIPSIDLYFPIFDYFCVHSHAIEAGWSVQVHFGGGLLKTTSFVWIYLRSRFSKPDFSPMQLKVSQYGVYQDYQGDLKASLAGGVCSFYVSMFFCISTIVFAYVTLIKSTYLLTYLLTYSLTYFTISISNLAPAALHQHQHQ